MPSLEEVLRQRKPYVGRINVKVVCKGKDGNRLRYGVSDGKTAAECELIGCDEDVVGKMAVGASVVIINASVKQYLRKYLQVTSGSRVTNTGTVDVPDSVRQQAEELINPAPAAFIKLDVVSTSPLKKLVSVKGQIVGEEMIKSVKSRGVDIAVKNVTIKEKSSRCRVALWRDVAHSPVSVGD
ncbi:uncharacterized protein [Asterias amurensis]|uniref:uncharacterized protein n=1 Tax=Asterias amurensis TaxID=7602 RepID=UPI003AB8620E